MMPWPDEGFRWPALPWFLVYVIDRLHSVAASSHGVRVALNRSGKCIS